MKLTSTSTACALLLGLIAAAQAQDTTVSLPNQADNKTAQAAAAAPQFTQDQLVEEFGWFVGKRVGLAELDFSPAEVQLLLKGIASAAEGKDSPFELEKIGPAMDQFMQRKQTAYISKLKERGEAESSQFMADLKKKTGVVVLPSGLAYEIEKQGEGPAPKPEDNVRVHYTGTLVNGQTFDSSHERGEPVTFALNQVIPGWTEGLQKISKGGKIKLYVPPQLAYGDEGRPGIPPASTLVFDVELLEINPSDDANAGQQAAPEQPAN